MKDKKFNSSLELMKLIRTILIILINTRPLIEVSLGLSYFLSNVLALGAVHYLFVVCGYSLSLELKSSNNKLETLLYNLKATFRVYVIWTLVYFIFYDLTYINLADLFTLNVFTTYLKKFFFLGSHFHLWYLPALMLTMVFTYIGDRYLLNKQLLLLAISLYGVGLLGTTYFNYK